MGRVFRRWRSRNSNSGSPSSSVRPYSNRRWKLSNETSATNFWLEKSAETYLAIIAYSNLALTLGRSRSTICREIKRGTVTQIKDVNGYQEEVNVYYADTGQAVYKKNRQKSQSKGLEVFSWKFWEDLKRANEDNWFTGKNRKYNIKFLIAVYRRENPLEKIPTYKTVYNYIHTGDFLLNRSTYQWWFAWSQGKTNTLNRRGANKRKLGRSISERPETVLNRDSKGHWEADLVEGKNGADEPAVLTLVERYSRFGISKKVLNKKSDTVQNALLKITQENPEMFNSITFDNGPEFSKAELLENDSQLDLKVYFCHAYSAWERGTNENFNKLLREFIPKGKSFHHYTDDEAIAAAQNINQRIREVNDYRSAEEVFWKWKIPPPRGRENWKH